MQRPQYSWLDTLTTNEFTDALFQCDDVIYLTFVIQIISLS